MFGMGFSSRRDDNDIDADRRVDFYKEVFKVKEDGHLMTVRDIKKRWIKLQIILHPDKSSRETV